MSAVLDDTSVSVDVHRAAPRHVAELPEASETAESKMLQRLISFVRGRSSKLTELERLVIAGLEASLTREAQQVLRAQLQEVNRIDRDGAEVRLYPMRNGRVDRRHPFPNRTRELEICRVRLRPAGGGPQLTAGVWLVEGSMSFIVYSDLPETAEYRVEGVDLLGNVMQAANDRERLDSPQPLPASWRGLAATDLRPPLSPPAFEDWRANSGATLPGDYAALLAASDGARVGDRIVYGVDDAYRTSIAGKEWLVIANVGGERLLVLAVGGDGRIFAFDPEDAGAAPQELGLSLREALGF